MLHAATLIGHPATEMIYVGDAGRDMQAGKAAHMGTIAARYGYMNADDNPKDWPADHHCQHASELPTLLMQLDDTLHKL